MTPNKKAIEMVALYFATEASGQIVDEKIVPLLHRAMDWERGEVLDLLAYLKGQFDSPEFYSKIIGLIKERKDL
jgi:hypothetical protein